MDKIQWLQDNWNNILAVLGAGYLLARVIVKLTPTPADDEALERVHVFILSIAKMFGLKITTQEEKDAKADPPSPPQSSQSGRASAEVLLLVALLFVWGCASSGDQYQASSIAFSAVVDTASELRKAGKLSKAQVGDIDAAVNAGATILSSWAVSLKAGKDYPDGPTTVAATVAAIQSCLAQKKE